jgi:hypothetical protein
MPPVVEFMASVAVTAKRGVEFETALKLAGIS